MSFRNLIDGNLNKAFNQVRDLASDAVLTRKSDPSFDFNSGAITTTDTTLNIKIIAVASTQKTEDHNVVKKEALMKSREIGALTPYDTLTFDGYEWNIGEKMVNSGFVFLVEIFREA
jgi:hypothetical protein